MINDDHTIYNKKNHKHGIPSVVYLILLTIWNIFFLYRAYQTLIDADDLLALFIIIIIISIISLLGLYIPNKVFKNIIAIILILAGGLIIILSLLLIISSTIIDYYRYIILIFGSLMLAYGAVTTLTGVYIITENVTLKIQELERRYQSKYSDFDFSSDRSLSLLV